MFGSAGGSQPDPMAMQSNSPSGTELYNYDGRTQAAAPASPFVIVTIGQSLVSNSVDSGYSTVNAGHVLNVSIQNGGTYRAVEPLLGCDLTGGNYAIRLADKLIAGSYCTDVVIVPVSIGGTSAAQWGTGALNYRIALALRRLAAIGLTPSVVFWHQGEADKTLGTTASAYQASVQAVIDTFRANGFSGPVLVAKESWNTGAVSTAVQTGQAALVNHAANVFAGADWDSMDNTYRQADQTHFNSTGADNGATLDLAALVAAGVI